jgi:RimJ/RimL family protein N-acetyltransferase
VRTDRLVLRPPRPEDADAVHRACLDPENQRWLFALPVPYTRESARVFVEEVAPGERAKGRALTAEVDGELVGAGGLHFVPGRLGPEIGYWIAPWARGRGYATEAARGLAEWGLAHGGRASTCTWTCGTAPRWPWRSGRVSPRKAWCAPAFCTGTAAARTRRCSA